MISLSNRFLQHRSLYEAMKSVGLADVSLIFESEVKTYLGVKAARIVGSVDEAYRAALTCAKADPDQPVYVSAFSATARHLQRLGIPIRWMDVDPLYLVPTTVNGLGTILLATHTFGQATDVAGFRKANPESVVIEDVSEALGATAHRRKVGSFGEVSILSFDASRDPSGPVEVGVVVAADDRMGERLAALTVATTSQEHIAAALVRFRQTESWVTMRRIYAKIYNASINNDRVRKPKERKETKHAFTSYVLRCEMRNRLIDYLARHGIEAAPALTDPTPAACSPEAAQAYRECLVIPLYPELEEKQVKYISEVINSFGA